MTRIIRCVSNFNIINKEPVYNIICMFIVMS